jgi:probable selenium-dependent hydroxylase accessory protein YqeC
MSRELREVASERLVKLAALLLPLLPDGKGVVSFVGAGGKTSLLVHFARELAEGGRPVLVTTTTKLADPRGDGDPFTRIVFRPDYGLATAEEAGEPPEPLPGVTLLVARVADEPGKLAGIDPARVSALRASWPVVLVEADGSKRLPIKAPETWEPVVPESTGVTVGVVGLDALGRPMDDRTVHRPDRFETVAGCAPGVPIGWDHLVALTRHPDGLFKAARGRRVVLLNKLDEAPFFPSAVQAAALEADLVVLSGEGDEGRFVFTFPREPLR